MCAARRLRARLALTRSYGHYARLATDFGALTVTRAGKPCWPTWRLSVPGPALARCEPGASPQGRAGRFHLGPKRQRPGGRCLDGCAVTVYISPRSEERRVGKE